ncbi:hypothetical protein B296_00023540 [Ensete ventricosum]|uniref:Uncharacterized protein n=1 Tax=Ensete ventricosum TaxID=4639 RepID=A0A427A4I6_ENSVE|nr:hypothetical protein B296_00023540 [Ensete ventricosum]
MRRGRRRRAKKVSCRQLLRFYLPSSIRVLDGDRRREVDRPRGAIASSSSDPDGTEAQNGNATAVSSPYATGITTGF